MTTTSKTKHVRIVTRGSKLALWQANFISGELQKLGATTELLVVKTTADRVQDRFLHEMGGKGLFIKELEDALLQGEADLAVHSLKDMPAKTPEGFTLVAIPARHSARDVLILHEKNARLWTRGKLLTEADVKQLGPLKVGTGSLRRDGLFRHSGAKIASFPIRGNVDTRIAKMRQEAWDGIVLAEASLNRLEINDVHAIPLDPTWFTPSASQGALALEALSASPIVQQFAHDAPFSSLNCVETNWRVSVERTVLARLGGDCRLPFSCHVTSSKTASGFRLEARAGVYGPDTRISRAHVHLESKTLDQLSHENLVSSLVATLAADDLNETLKSLGLDPVNLGANLGAPREL